MLRIRTQVAVACVMVANLTLATAGAPVIGVAIKSGSFMVDGARIDGNATVLEGNRIDSGSGSTRLQLSNGNRLKLGADSTGSIYRNRLVLERGTGEVQTTTAFYLEALNLRVETETPKTRARVALTAPGLLHVDAVDGAVQVSTSKGVLLARLEPGTSLEFAPPPDGAMAPSKLTGIVRKIGEKYVLSEETSKLIIELRGADVASLLGERVEIEGVVLAETSNVQGVSEVVKVVRATKVARPRGIAKGPHVPTAVIAGVGVAAAAAGAGVIVSQKNDTKSVSPSSR